MQGPHRLHVVGVGNSAIFSFLFRHYSNGSRFESWSPFVQSDTLSISAGPFRCGSALRPAIQSRCRQVLYKIYNNLRQNHGTMPRAV